MSNLEAQHLNLQMKNREHLLKAYHTSGTVLHRHCAYIHYSNPHIKNLHHDTRFTCQFQSLRAL